MRIKNIARVELGAQSYQWYAQLDGAPSIAIAVYQLPAPTRWTWPETGPRGDGRAGPGLPRGLRVPHPVRHHRVHQQSIKEVITTLIIAILLVVFTVYIFLQDFRTTLVPAITIPVSLLGTFA